MTQEQQKLVTDNLGLVYWYMKKYNLNNEQFEGILTESLCKSAVYYNSTREIKFVTFAVYCFRMAVAKYYRDSSMDKRKANHDALSLESTLENGSGDDYNSLLSVLPNPKHTVESTELSMDIRDLLDKLPNLLNSKELECLKYSLAGYCQEDIATLTGHSQSYVSRLVSSAGRKAKEYYLYGKHKPYIRTKPC